MSSDVERFVVAQRGSYDAVMAELAAGRKQGHWIWFVFPQVAGLGTSPMAALYAIASLAEAQAYLAHPVLGPRLQECAQLLLVGPGRTAESVFGALDAVKLRSSMTLFNAVAPDQDVFQQVLDRFYDGLKDPATERIVALWLARP